MQLKGLFHSSSLWLKCLLIFLIPSLFSILAVMPFSIIFAKGEISYANTAIGFINYAELLQLSQSIIGMVLASIFLVYVLFEEPWKTIGLHQPLKPNLLLLVPLAVLFSQPLITIIANLNLSIRLPEFLSEIETWMKTMETNATEMIQLMIGGNGPFECLFTLFLIAVVPAVGEELLFRGVLQKTLISHIKNYHIAIWISAFVFSFIHLQFFGFFPRLLLGALFGYLFVWTKSIWVPMLAHFINNAIAAISLLIYGEEVLELSAKSTYQIGEGFEYSLYLTSFLLGSITFLIMRNIYLHYKDDSSISS